MGLVSRSYSPVAFLCIFHLENSGTFWKSSCEYKLMLISKKHASSLVLYPHNVSLCHPVITFLSVTGSAGLQDTVVYPAT